jgi:hypothetical protein
MILSPSIGVKIPSHGPTLSEKMTQHEGKPHRIESWFQAWLGAVIAVTALMNCVLIAVPEPCFGASSQRIARAAGFYTVLAARELDGLVLI